MEEGKRLMCDGEGYSLEEAHSFFAADYNGKVWGLLEKADRTSEEDSMLLNMAHASCAHWLEAGSAVHRQRGEWMISRVNTILGFGDAALRHAGVCLELTGKYPDEMDDFDVAFACEAMARASALSGDGDTAREYICRAEEAGRAIADPEDRKIFEDDLAGGNWFGVR